MASTSSVVSDPKRRLHQAFKLLKSHACKVADFTLQWHDLEHHLRFIHSQIESKLQQYHDPEPPQNPVNNGKQLLLYVKDHSKDIGKLQNLFKVVEDSGKLVLEALEGFYPPASACQVLVLDSDMRKNCVVLLEEFGRMRVGESFQVKPQVREDAIKLALHWKGRLRLRLDNNNSLEVVAFLRLLVAFGLVVEFSCDEILKLFNAVVMRREAPRLFRALGFADKASDFIQNLIKMEKRLEAIRFIYEFKLVNRFPPVPLLKSHERYAKRAARRIRKKGNNTPKAKDDATKSEIAALRGIIRLIEDYQLGSQYPSKMLQNHIQQLKQRKERTADAKNTSPNAHSQPEKRNKRAAHTPQAQQNQQDNNKMLRTAATNASVNTSQTVYSKQASRHQPTSLFAGQGAEYSTLSVDIDAPSKAAPYAHVDAAFNSESIQPYPGQPSGLFTGAQHLARYFGKYHNADLVVQDSAGINVLSKASSYGYVGTGSYTRSRQPAPVQPAGLFIGAQHLTVPLRNYHSGETAPVPSYTSLGTGLYGLSGSASGHPHISSSPGLHERSIAANVGSGQFGLPGTRTPMLIASSVSTNVSDTRYHGDLLGTSACYNRKASSGGAGIFPNISGYYDRAVSNGSNYGGSCKYPPSIYNP